MEMPTLGLRVTLDWAFYIVLFILCTTFGVWPSVREVALVTMMEIINNTIPHATEIILSVMYRSWQK